MPRLNHNHIHNHHHDWPAVKKVDVSVFTVPTDAPEADGTFSWSATTVVVVEIHAGNETGIGYTYADSSTAAICRDLLERVVMGRNPSGITAIWQDMIRQVRNFGRYGVCSTAIAAIDCALWDLKAKLLGVSLLELLGPVRKSVPVYGSGGFTSYSFKQLETQMGEWVRMGLRAVKMKVGSFPEDDVRRVRFVRSVVGPEVALFVDANGAYGKKQALQFAAEFALWGVSWFEEPVSSDDLEGLNFVRGRVPAGIEISAGEYGYDHLYFKRMLTAEAVDVLQADVTRCEGITGFLKAAALCEAFEIPLSTHCAPSLHATLGCALTPVRHLEYFHDHVRIEKFLFDGTLDPLDGSLFPDLSRRGLGLTLKRRNAQRYAV